MFQSKLMRGAGNFFNGKKSLKPTITYGNSIITGGNATEYANYIYCEHVFVSDGGNVNSISKYVVSSGSAKIKFAFYTDSGGSPANLVSNSVSSEMTLLDNSYITFNYTTKPKLISNSDYWFAFLSDANHTIKANASFYQYMSNPYSNGFSNIFTMDGSDAAQANGFYFVLQPI
jgi:hypothetical protein